MRDIYGLPTDPATLKEIMGNAAATAFFEGLTMELPHAISTGKLDAWTNCAQSIVALLVTDSQRRFPVNSRAA